MPVTRRGFLKLSGLTAAGTMLGSFFSISGCKRGIEKLKGTKKTYSICPFCSVGCGVIVSTRKGVLINVEGDPENPINGGFLCSKGNSLYQAHTGLLKSRLKKVLYRKPGALEWEEIGLNDAIAKISKNIKKTRDETFIGKENGITVNRADGFAILGGQSLNNEEVYLWSKFARIAGIINLESESGLLTNRSAEALSGALGFYGMPNHWIDFKNSDVIMAIGCNPAENHTIAFKHIQEALGKGCRLISVDPRYTRTSSLSHLYASIRPGTDIAFINGIINYALNNNRIHKEYVVEYTNASVLINPSYGFNDGIFSGFDKENKKYDTVTWSYRIDAKGIPKKDKSLKDPFSVYQLLKRHVSRYTPHKVSSITGCHVETFLKAAEIFISTSGPGKSGSIIFSSGATQHTTGVQTIRAYTILQLLLGNIGISGGGVNCLMEGPNGLGAMDHGFQSSLLPGYLSVPFDMGSDSFSSFIKHISPVTNDPMSVNFWGIDGSKKGSSRTKKIMASLLKAWFGDAADEKNDFCFNWMPKTGNPQKAGRFFENIEKGKVKGAIFIDADPVMNFPESVINGDSLGKLDWLVCTGAGETATSNFWKGNRAGKTGTEVFLLPASLHFEKEGSMTNSGRWAQWCGRAMVPAEGAITPLDLVNILYKRLKGLYKNEGGKFPDPILKANWSYNKTAGKTVDPKKVAGEINGYNIKSKQSIKDHSELKENGVTACGNWLYAGSCINGINNMARRGKSDGSEAPGSYPGWSWSWPGNMRILYNAASVDSGGKPWDEKREVIKWNGSTWQGDESAIDGNPGTKNPFVMLEEGLARIFAPHIEDGPLPEHYEPVESPFGNAISSQRNNPILGIEDIKREKNKKNSQYTRIGTICSASEHSYPVAIWGEVPWLKELAPDTYCEISNSLAEKLEIENGGSVLLKSAGGKLSAFAFVTERLKAWEIEGERFEMITVVSKSGARKLAGSACDPNSGVGEYKSFLLQIEKDKSKGQEG